MKLNKEQRKEVLLLFGDNTEDAKKCINALSRRKDTSYFFNSNGNLIFKSPNTLKLVLDKTKEYKTVFSGVISENVANIMQNIFIDIYYLKEIDDIKRMYVALNDTFELLKLRIKEIENKEKENEIKSIEWKIEQLKERKRKLLSNL